VLSRDAWAEMLKAGLAVPEGGTNDPVLPAGPDTELPQAHGRPSRKMQPGLVILAAPLNPPGMREFGGPVLDVCQFARHLCVPTVKGTPIRDRRGGP